MMKFTATQRKRIKDVLKGINDAPPCAGQRLIKKLYEDRKSNKDVIRFIECATVEGGHVASLYYIAREKNPQKYLEMCLVNSVHGGDFYSPSMLSVWRALKKRCPGGDIIAAYAGVRKGALYAAHKKWDDEQYAKEVKKKNARNKRLGYTESWRFTGL